MTFCGKRYRWLLYVTGLQIIETKSIIHTQGDNKGFEAIMWGLIKAVFPREYFLAIKFLVGNENSMGKLKIPKSWKVWKEVEKIGAFFLPKASIKGLTMFTTSCTEWGYDLSILHCPEWQTSLCKIYP